MSISTWDDYFTLDHVIVKKKMKELLMTILELSERTGIELKRTQKLIYPTKCRPTTSEVTLIAKALGMELSEIATHNETSKRERIPAPVEVIKNPFALNCRELLSPVEIVKANPVQTSDFAHWVSLPETPNPHIEHKIDGVVAFRYENGNSVLFANEYVNPIHFPMAMEQIRKWGENVHDNGNP